MLWMGPVPCSVSFFFSTFIPVQTTIFFFELAFPSFELPESETLLPSAESRGLRYSLRPATMVNPRMTATDPNITEERDMGGERGTGTSVRMFGQTSTSPDTERLPLPSGKRHTPDALVSALRHVAHFGVLSYNGGNIHTPTMTLSRHDIGFIVCTAIAMVMLTAGLLKTTRNLSANVTPLVISTISQQ